MAEYVKRDDALCALEQINPVDYGAMWDYEAHHYAGECLRDCKEAIENIPAADVAPVIHARWIGSKYDPETGDYMEKCSHCGVFSREYWKPHCSECGALMDLDEQGEKQDV